MLDLEDIEWLHRLSGYPSDAILGAIERVEGWSIPGLSGQLGEQSSADGHLAAMMLCQALDWLVSAGVDESRLLARLKRPDVWPMWTEIRVAGLIAHFSDDVEHVELDVPVGPGSGHNTDFRFSFANDPDLHRIEVKALGLSAKEREFCRRWAPILRAIVPTRGVCIIHAGIDTEPPALNRRKRREIARDAARNARHKSPPCGPVSATVVAAHGTREQYVSRLSAIVNEHLAQLPDSDVGWMAFHWSNGAPLDLIAQAISEAALPEHIAGVMLAGSAIILDGQMHHFFIAGAKSSDGSVLVQSKIEGFDASPIVAGFEASVGVRPTILRVPGSTGPRELLARDGSEPLWPYNILPSPDPSYIEAMI